MKRKNRSIFSLFVLLSLPVSIFGQQGRDEPLKGFASDLSGDVATYPRNAAKGILSDQLQIWTFPRHLKRKEVLLPTLAVAGATAGLIALVDRPSAGYFGHTSTFRDLNQTFSGENTKLVMLALPAAYYGLGLVKQDSYARETALLAGEAALDAQLVTLAAKRITGRLAPPGFREARSDTWFQTSQGAFPSSHTSTAFALATVFSQRYRDHKWVPYLAYSTAALVGVSTITQQGHSPSDVFLGAVVGYSISRFVVLQRQGRGHWFAMR